METRALTGLPGGRGGSGIFVGGQPIERVFTFKYQGRVLNEADDDTKCIDAQLEKARSKW